MPGTTHRRPELPSLTGIRFLLAIPVFAFHVDMEKPFGDHGVADAYAWTVSNGGWTAISLFFVLSGFVITWGSRPEHRAGRFWRGRAAKIYPLHVLTWAAALILLAVAGTAATARQAVPNLFLVHTWNPDRAVFSSLNDVSWSISCEVFFYAAFPLLVRWIRRIRPERLWYWAAAVIAAILLVPAASALLPDRPPLPFGSGSVRQFWFVYVFPPVRLLEFVLGILLARIVRTGRRLPLGAAAAALLFVPAQLLAKQLPFLWGLTTPSIIPIALLLPALAARDLAGRTSLLTSRPLVTLGNWTFAFYLVHRLILDHGHRALGGGQFSTPVATALLLGAFAAAWLLAGALHRYVELPAVRLLTGSRTRPGGPTRQGSSGDPAPAPDLATTT
ncbi:acyltransferase family protein [Streptomyces sp. 1331.2]|uniref:acyltransferase family protein n=1 Tax=Streptomyces sp. 1331.2 TaxID=1938835 RepID=UPI000BD0BE99|nr:acyltransferase [Streptomyces sp. 1331.2]SOB84179.1 Peptidoglycan/LPS O-acetylase OafA/YrhL, contains acyltransferase and SGNH-hydrolase domains [Streptomyces sp. 1331.2]